MQDNDLNIEDFKEIFMKSLFGETVSAQEISEYFEIESRKFIKWLSNELSNENDTQRFKDILFKKFIKGIEEANTNLSKPFIEYEQNRTWDMMAWKGKGIDISEMEKPSKYLHQIKLDKLCKKLSGVDIWLEQIEFIYEGFKLFKQQHEEESNATALPTNTKPQKQQTGFYLGLLQPQLETLHTELINNNFLAECEFTHFENAFNGKDLTGNFKKLEWIDETQRNHYVSIHTVFQLLDSCKIDFRGEYNIIPEVKEKIKLIFKNDFGNIPSKFNDFTPLKTKRYKLIDSIINLKP